MPIRRCFFVVFFLLTAVLLSPAYADGGLLWGATDRQPIVVPRSDPLHTVTANVPSLFIGSSGHSLFAPYPVRAKAPVYIPPAAGDGSAASRIRDIIASAEAGRAGYDAVVWAARIKPPQPPTAMTVGDIYDWIVATPNQHHAIGRYQFIPSTLRRLVALTGAGRDQLFSPAYQDQLADILLAEAGLEAFHANQIGRAAFMNNLAKIWAGLPNTSGKSHYHGISGNKATMTWATFNAQMAAIYPDSS